MALILKDRVQETSTTTGTGTLTLAGAVTQFQTFSSAIGNGNTTYYTIYNSGGSLWEVGIGTVGAGTLSRDTVLSSSNAGSLVSFTGTLYVFCDYPASKSVSLDSNGKASYGGNSYEDFASIATPSYVEGRSWYDSTAHALAYYNDVSSSIVHIGQDLQVKVINNTGSTIANGSPVYITSTSSGQTYPNIALAKADVAATAAVIGLTNGSIANGAVGYVTSQGGIDGLNTGSFTVGQVLYLSPYSAGQLQNTIPPTGITVQVGVVSYVDSSAGKIYVKQTTPLNVPASIISGQVALANGGTGANLTATAGSVPYSTSSAIALSAVGTAGQVLTSQGTSAPTWTTPATGTVTSVTGTAPIASSGGTTPAISISQATTSTNGYLSSTDWNTFNNKGTGTVTSVTGTAPVVSSGGATPAISMAAANTTTNGYLTSTDWNTFNGKGSGTVTSVAALTLGTTGTDLSSTVATGTTTPVITLQVPTASATNRGALSAADWTTFNNKGSGTVTSVAATVPSVFSISGSPITTSGTLAITYSGTALPIANGGTNSTATPTAGGAVYGTGTAYAITAAGTSGQVLTSNGASAPTWQTASTGGLSWQSVQTTNFAATAGNGYPVNTTSSAITVTLPASPSAGNFITLSDYAGTFATNNLTINPNGKNINGVSSNKLIVNNRYSVNLVYIDATQGWISYADNTTTPANPPYTATYLIAAGGGSGGNAPSGDGGQGGGGAGGLLTGTTTVTVGTTYSFVVGGGGATNTNGSNSTGFSLTAIGGGKGGQPDATPGSAGGSGGGGSENGSPAGGAGTSGQGNNGGAGGPTIVGGGGGGAGAVGTAGYYSGSDNGANYGGPGGVGSTTSLITTSQATTASVGQVVSSSVYFCGGGGASMYGGWTPASNSGSPGSGGGGQGAKNSTNATAGSANSGGGGGGLGSGESGATTGGSGVVLLSVPTASYSGTYTGSSVSVVTNGSNTVLIFKSSGSYTA